MAKLNDKTALTFDDVALVPQYNNVASRTEPDLSSWVTTFTKTGLPVIPANMDTVMGPSLAKVCLNNGIPPIFHRFTDFNEKYLWLSEFGNDSYISCGCRDDHLQELVKLADTSGKFFKGVCFDIAHGHSTLMEKSIKEFKKEFPKAEVIAGNVCTAVAYHDLCNWGADAIKVGIGPGAACTTRMVTGFGVPQLSAIMECSEVAERMRVPLIADGGIRDSRDIVLALAAGASSVMMGKLFALTMESAAEKDTSHSPVLAKYRGQASKDFQHGFYGGLKTGTVPEGESFWSPVSGSSQDLLDSLMGGLRSGLTYAGARTIKELQRKAEFRVVTSTYMSESRPRK